MNKLKMHTPDFTNANIARIAELFPGCVTETRDDATGKVAHAIDFDQLRQELIDHIVDGPRERYQLDWPGKRESLVDAIAPISKSLRPQKLDSVDFGLTRNLFIEGDNLEALKLLQETYLRQVRVIYIDPPYNTGKDFVYRDHFAMEKEAYEQQSGQVSDAGGRLVANPETAGRYHSNWLTMIYPRLMLAKNLLSDDGVIMISIDDHELANLRILCDQVFGRHNFIATLVWEKGRKNDAKLFSVGHEYLVVYARSQVFLRDCKTVWREEKPGARDIWERYLELRAKHGESNALIEADLQAWYSALPAGHPAKKWSRYKRIDKNGPWRDRDISWPGGDGPRYNVLHPKTKKPCKVPERGWIYASEEEMDRQIKLGMVEFREDETEPPFRKAHIRPIPDELDLDEDPDSDSNEGGEEEFATQVRGSYFYKQSQVSVKYLRKLLGMKAFTNPKDHFELSRLFAYVTSEDPNAVFMDFFAGSGSTAHAVMALNAADGGKRRFIVVQYPETLDASKKEQKIAAAFCDKIGKPRNVAEIAKERLRRAAKEISDGVTLTKPPIDAGFRVLKIDDSNMKDVFYAPDAVDQLSLSGLVDNIKEDRTDDDLIFQILLDWGVDLTLPIKHEVIRGKTVHFVDTTALAACFESGIDESFIKELAKHKPLRAVFRDNGFGSDASKINVEQIFKLLSPTTEVKSI